MQHFYQHSLQRINCVQVEADKLRLAEVPDQYLVGIYINYTIVAYKVNHQLFWHVIIMWHTSLGIATHDASMYASGCHCDPQLSLTLRLTRKYNFVDYDTS